MTLIDVKQREKAEHDISSMLSILHFYLADHTPEVTHEQYFAVNDFNAWVEAEAKRRLA